MERCGSSSGGTSKKVTIHNCGQVEANSEPSAKRAKVDVGADAPEEVQVLHIIRKHKGSRRPSSWREATITSSREDAQDFLRGVATSLKGMDRADLKSKFAELATKNSDCGSHKKGGDLGLFGRGRMQKAFEEASFALKAGE